MNGAGRAMFVLAAALILGFASAADNKAVQDLKKLVKDAKVPLNVDALLDAIVADFETGTITDEDVDRAISDLNATFKGTHIEKTADAARIFKALRKAFDEELANNKIR